MILIENDIFYHQNSVDPLLKGHAVYWRVRLLRDVETVLTLNAAEIKPNRNTFHTMNK